MRGIRVNTRHLMSDEAYAEVSACHGNREVSGACAVTIASWWQSPGPVGRVLAAFASGSEVDRSELSEDVSRTILHEYDSAEPRDRLALDMLGTWVLNGSPHVDYPHFDGYLPDCAACEERCHCNVSAVEWGEHAECVYSGTHATDPDD